MDAATFSGPNASRHGSFQVDQLTPHPTCRAVMSEISRPVNAQSVAAPAPKDTPCQRVITLSDYEYNTESDEERYADGLRERVRREQTDTDDCMRYFTAGADHQMEEIRHVVNVADHDPACALAMHQQSLHSLTTGTDLSHLPQHARGTASASHSRWMSPRLRQDMSGGMDGHHESKALHLPGMSPASF